MNKTSWAIAIFLFSNLLDTQAFAAPHPTTPSRALTASRTSQPINIDGSSKEPAWRTASRSSDFTERAPNLFESPPVKTEARAVYDDRFLYILVTGELSNPKPAIHTLQRDAPGLLADDTISVKIDSTLDRRSSYIFSANLAGAQADTLALEDGQVEVSQWNAVWRAKSQVNAGHFETEFAIPWYALGIHAQDEVTLGLNITRSDPHRAATYDWNIIVPPRSPNGASAYGTLRGIKHLNSKLVLETSAFIVGQSDFSPRFHLDPRHRPNLSAGADFRLQTGNASYVEASILTDFSQVDLDQVRVANDRFPLFFKERRPFFLNGLDVFRFGMEREARIFFTRRVGLDGQAIPILGGAKAYGRTPKIAYGVLNVQTMGKPALPSDNEEQDSTPPENFSVARFRYQPIPQVAMGVLGAFRKRFGPQNGDALSGGVDLEARTKNTKFRSYSAFAGSWTGVSTGADETKGLSALSQASYQGLYLRPKLTWIWSNEGFSAPLGFYTRPGTSQKTIELGLVPRPKILGLREVLIRPRLSWISLPDLQSTLTLNSNILTSFVWKSQWVFEHWFAYVSDQVRKDFVLYNNHNIVAGRYRNWDTNLAIGSPENRPFQFALQGGTGQRFGGPAHLAALSWTTRWGRHVSLAGVYIHRWGHFGDPRSPYNVGVLNADMVVAFHRKLIWDTLFRVNLGSADNRFALQSRLRWRYRPGSDLFLVYSRNQPFELGPDSGPRDHQLTLKLSLYLAPAISFGRRRGRSARGRHKGLVDASRATQKNPCS